MEDCAKVCDVIIIPGCLQWEHVETAARMYREGFAKYVVPCGRYSYNDHRFKYEEITDSHYAGQYETEAEYFRYILMKNGVPDEAIICENESQNTFENASFSAKLLKEKGIPCKSIMLCCKAFHARRAFMTFERYFPESDFCVTPTVSQGISRENWYRTRESFLTVMSELEKCGKFFNDMYPLLQKCNLMD